MTFHEIWSIITPSIVGVSGILAGIWIGQHLSDRKEKRQKAEELEKIRYFLNADFSLVQRTLTKILKIHTEMHDTIVIKNQHGLYMSDRKALEKLLVDLRINTGYFSYWELLVTSGSLIKLNPDELRIIENAHRSIMEYRRIETDGLQKFNDRFIEKFLEQGVTIDVKNEFVRERCNLYFQGIFKTYEYIQNRLTTLKNNISWINLSTEPIMELKGEPKMKIDSKGTYTIE